MAIASLASCTSSTESPESYEQKRRAVDRDLIRVRADLAAADLGTKAPSTDWAWAYGRTNLCKGSDDEVGYVIDATVNISPLDTAVALEESKKALQESGFDVTTSEPGATGFVTLQASKGSTRIAVVPGHPTTTDALSLTGSTECTKVGAKVANRLVALPTTELD
ncbi:MAG: hypothetical protein H7201_06725 [Candidatus Saccharibacteria bacterium]|nr:hypothetical protein [Microbacteriaceae bacterium]